jgi:hypothetical protein
MHCWHWLGTAKTGPASQYLGARQEGWGLLATWRRATDGNGAAQRRATPDKCTQRRRARRRDRASGAPRGDDPTGAAPAAGAARPGAPRAEPPRRATHGQGLPSSALPSFAASDLNSRHLRACPHGAALSDGIHDEQARQFFAVILGFSTLVASYYCIFSDFRTTQTGPAQTRQASKRSHLGVHNAVEMLYHNSTKVQRAKSSRFAAFERIVWANAISDAAGPAH